jgi:Family of unknown function (DUF6101)
VTYATRDADGDVSFTIDERGAVIKRVLPNSHLPMSIALPPKAFQGVTARAIEDAEGEVTVTLELMHNDPQLSVPLLVADDFDDIAADWRAWSEAFGLPMMLVEADGVARPLEESIGQVKAQPVKPRRHPSNLAERRPRFLARRKTGDLGLRVVVNGEEMISLA